MHTPRLRTTRTLRKRVAKKHQPRIAQNIHLGRQGITLDGQPFPFHVAPDIDVDTLTPDLHTVTLRIYTDNVTIDNQLPAHTTVTHTTHG